MTSIEFKRMAWFWYGMAWGQLLTGVLSGHVTNLAIAVLNFAIFVAMLWESKR